MIGASRLLHAVSFALLASLVLNALGIFTAIGARLRLGIVNADIFATAPRRFTCFLAHCVTLLVILAKILAQQLFVGGRRVVQASFTIRLDTTAQLLASQPVLVVMLAIVVVCHARCRTHLAISPAILARLVALCSALAMHHALASNIQQHQLFIVQDIILVSVSTFVGLERGRRIWLR